MGLKWGGAGHRLRSRHHSAALGAAGEPLHGVLKQLAVSGQAELVFDGLAVGFDGLDRKREFLGDLARTHATADHVEDLYFAVRQARHGVVGLGTAFAGTLIKGTLDVLMEAGWVRPAGRREVPGRPLTYATTANFLAHFGLQSRRDLPGIDDLKAAGLLDPIDSAMEQLSVGGDERELELESDRDED